MIITDKFVWFHLPKTAGTHTRKLLVEFYGDEVLYNAVKTPQGKTRDRKGRDTLGNPAKAHLLAIPGQFADFKSKDWIINFRKLPSWLISKTNHVSRKGRIVGEKATRLAQEAFQEGKSIYKVTQSSVEQCNCQSLRADDTLRKFMHVFHRMSPTVPGRVIIINQENYTKDFKKVLELYPPKNLDKNKYQLIENQRLNYHPHNRSNLLEINVEYNKLDKQSLAKIYEANPLWTSIERQIYKDSHYWNV